MIIKYHLSDLTHLINTFIRKQIVLFSSPHCVGHKIQPAEIARSRWQDSDRCRVFISEEDRQEWTRRQVIGSHFSQKGKIISRFGPFLLPSVSIYLSWSFATQSCHRAEDETNERLENVKMFARPKIENNSYINYELNTSARWLRNWLTITATMHEIDNLTAVLCCVALWSGCDCFSFSSNTTGGMES